MLIDCTVVKIHLGTICRFKAFKIFGGQCCSIEIKYQKTKYNTICVRYNIVESIKE